jgi:CheY-like chemotaxis protein
MQIRERMDPVRKHGEGHPQRRLFDTEPLVLTVLLAEDDPALRSMLAAALRRDGHHVRELCDGGELEAELVLAYGEHRPGDPDCLVIADVRMPIIDGLEVLQGLRARGHRPAFMLMSAFADAQVKASAQALDAVAVFDKPFDVDGLRAAVLYYARWRGSNEPERRRG